MKSFVMTGNLLIESEVKPIQSAITCSKLTIEKLEQDVKYVKS